MAIYLCYVFWVHHCLYDCEWSGTVVLKRVNDQLSTFFLTFKGAKVLAYEQKNLNTTIQDVFT
jgi:hypothetical protein